MGAGPCCLPGEGIWPWRVCGKEPGGDPNPPLRVFCPSPLLSAPGPQQDPELYRWQPASAQNRAPQLQALPERDRQEGEAAQEAAGRWVKPRGCRGGQGTGPRCLLRGAQCEGVGRAVGAQGPPGAPLRPGLGHGDAVEWMFLGVTRQKLATGRKICRRTQGSHHGQGPMWSHSPHPVPGS